ncbi:MAG: hypothetical protein ACRC1P_09565 [Cellulosilyticaceae bacterium]
MRELLLSKGFVFNDYDYANENVYEYWPENGDENIPKIAAIFEFTDDGSEADLLLCCDENFTEFTACCYTEEKHFTKDEFERLVRRM